MDQNEAKRIMEALSSPFTADEVDWRVGSTTKDKTSGLALAYVDARTVADRLDAVCGIDWRCSYPTIARSAGGGDDDGGRGGRRGGNLIVCRIELRICGEWIGRENGAGDTAVEAAKGGLSDAFKRAATLWGVGRYLYAFPSPWVRINGFKAIEKDEWPKLRALAAKALADYQRDPKAFRAPVPEAPPERPGFTTAEPPRAPMRPAQAQAPAAHAAPAEHVFASTSALTADVLSAPVASLAEAVRLARSLAADAGAVAKVEQAYLARALQLLDAAQGREDVDAVTAALNACKPAPESRGSLQKAVQGTRARLAQAAQGAAS